MARGYYTWGTLKSHNGSILNHYSLLHCKISFTANEHGMAQNCIFIEKQKPLRRKMLHQRPMGTVKTKQVVWSDQSSFGNSHWILP